MADQIDRLKAALSDRYTIERELGRGGMAVVYLAQDLKHERQVAIKVLRSELAASIGADRFLQEVKIAANLTHPHILPLHDSGEADGFLYYVMPYIEGESLRDKLAKEGELPVAEAVRILRDVVDALSHAHKHNVVHRDIKPDNVMLSDRHALVTDFGVAKAVSEATGRQQLTTEGVALGTPTYMAPEQAAADPHIDHRADIYAVGAVAYELLTGRPPFLGTTPQMILSAHMTDSPEPVTKYRDAVPPALEQLVMKCLEKKAADRWQTAEELLPQLEALATPSGGTTPTDMTPQARMAGTQRRALAIVAVSTVVVAMTAVTLLLTRGTQSEEDPPRLMVGPFENRTGETTAGLWGEMAADRVTRAIDEAGFIDIVPNSARREALRELDVSEGVPIPALAERVGANVALAGSYVLSGVEIRFELEIVEPATGHLIRTLKPVAGPVDSIDAIVSMLAELAVVTSMIHYDPDTPRWIASMSIPHDRELLREYRAARESWCQGLDSDAWQHVQEALATDSTFVPVLLLAVRMHSEPQQADSVVSQLVPLSEAMTAHELVEFDYLRAGLRGDLPAVLQHARNGYRLDQHRWAVWTGTAAVRNNRPAEALETLADYELDADCGQTLHEYWSVLIRAHHMLGQHDAELESVRRARRSNPEQHEYLRLEVKALAALGQVDAVDSVLSLAFTFPQTGRGYGNYAVDAALEFQAHGYSESYTNVIERAVAWLERRAPGEVSRFDRARILYYAERYQQAYVILDSLVNANPDWFVALSFLGSTAAYLGRRQEAEEIDLRLRDMALDMLYDRWMVTVNRAPIAAALGDREKAVLLLNQGFREGAGFMSGWYHEAVEFAPLRDYPPFQEFVRPKG